MKKLFFILFFSITCAFAQDDCIVLGFHQPGTQTYEGPTWCEKKSINKIIVHGPLQADQSTLTGDTSVSGPIKSDHTQFDGIKITDQLTTEIVSLTNHSLVKKDLVFNGQKGTVILDKTSKVLGKIINAHVETHQ
ncbi:MAG: hypothetical protein A3I77_08270 [Gammaproteobacteria bacterium RIFCSPLOWO2_02_FULL_42_14]|nr:MAG: hypothetical protein A3B71_04105 [Gammaproteobacteria bacterium RIFCSPHIGHO2_02_FULL_42_43]OGT27584.1 MAG: hypothetical protein A2624_00410 [Gammaproteobacteria bacterium RIFCSPHIGHO2_01_FULL_42_8]OGT52901.1 MAG: hypothetical protein A3E54_07420 [Gammaproteobacteria bacterium RIFCSPHIGHO2_12_FULL_41_25]OGT61326.1 MAG: hypothetical protein A3I77_08270 [Gammaproteobacteria bacterium RIFCSPLOWO2_02_FULL_42_14]OGT87255.1 MAG: hypothetical protein A3G86_01995 [Gammaproteobacteria bacterium R